MDALFNIFLTYGWTGIIAIIACICLYFFGRYMIKRISKNMSSGLEEVGKTLTEEISTQNKALTTEISKQNNELVSTIINQQDILLKHLINKSEDEKNKHNSMLEKRIQLSEEISNNIKEIGLLHNAQRVLVLEFHNSYQNLSGTPFAKYSCTYEWFEKGLQPIQFNCKDLPFSSLSHVVSDLIKSKDQQIVYDDMHVFADKNIGLYTFFRNDDTSCIIYTAMYDKNNILMGLLVLEYKTDAYKHINLNQLHIQSAELTSILNLRYKYLK